MQHPALHIANTFGRRYAVGFSLAVCLSLIMLIVSLLRSMRALMLRTHSTQLFFAQRLQAALCRAAAVRDYSAFLQLLSPSSSAGCCTHVWKAGAIAYRCRTCQLTASSAVCPACFKAGGHESHDYVMYK